MFEIDDRLMDFGVLDGAQRLEHLSFGGHQDGLRGISTTCVGTIADVSGADLSPDEFAAAVIAVTSAFGDPTRRDIYLFVRSSARRRQGRRGRGALRPASERRPPSSREARVGWLPRRRARASLVGRSAVEVLPGRRRRHAALVPAAPRRSARDIARPRPRTIADRRRTQHRRGSRPTNTAARSRRAWSRPRAIVP